VHAQWAEYSSKEDSLFTDWANHMALTSGLPCDTANKIVQDSARHFVYVRAKAGIVAHKGNYSSTFTDPKTGKRVINSLYTNPESETIPLDPASLEFVMKKRIRPENCK